MPNSQPIQPTEQPRDTAQAYVVMGVSGCGKSTVGRALAERLGGVFYDGDDFHPPQNIAKMSRGEALTDADRAPWLAQLAQVPQARIRVTTTESPTERPCTVSPTALTRPAASCP